MATTGMNPAEVRRMADQLRQAADRLRNVVSTVDARVARSSWVGPQADRFRRQAWPGNRKRLLLAADGLSGLARSAWNNADEQERVSRAVSTSSVGDLSLVGRVVDAFSDSVVGLGETGGMQFNDVLLGILGLPGVIAPQGHNVLKTWTGYYLRAIRNARGPLRGVLDRMTPAFRAADRLDAVQWLRKPGSAQDLLKIGQSPALDKFDRIFGVYSVGKDVAGVNQSWRNGDKVGAGLHAVDTVAGIAKMSKNPLLFAGGVVVDGVTDLVNVARGKPEKNWRPWNLL